MGDFTSDWFSSAIPGIKKSLSTITPRRFLEIGSWEGRSACWFMTEFPEASIVCIDTFQGSEEHREQGLDIASTKSRFLRNTSPFGNRVTVLQGHSSKKLFSLEPESFDCVYVDGSHTEEDTLTDLIIAFQLLAPGGILLVDDYNQTAFPGVRKAVDTFARVYSSRLRCILCEYQVHFVKGM